MTLREQLRGIAIGVVLAGSVLVPMMLKQRGDADRDIGLERDGREAQADTTRRLKLAVGLMAAGDQMFQRRVVQATLRADGLDRALRQTSLARTSAAVYFAPFDTMFRARTTQETGGVRVVAVDLKKPPYWVYGKVVSPPAPQLAQIELHIRQDSMPISLRLACGEPVRANNNVRPALFELEVPAWAKPKVLEATQTPELCNAKTAHWITDWKTLTLATLSLILGLRR